MIFILIHLIIHHLSSNSHWVHLLLEICHNVIDLLMIKTKGNNKTFSMFTFWIYWFKTGANLYIYWITASLFLLLWIFEAITSILQPIFNIWIDYLWKLAAWPKYNLAPSALFYFISFLAFFIYFFFYFSYLFDCIVNYFDCILNSRIASITSIFLGAGACLLYLSPIII